MGFAGDGGRWGPEDGERLADRRRKLRHTQEQSAGEIRRLGATRASQSSVYNWERARTGPASENLAAVRAYMGEPPPPAASTQGRPRRPRPGRPPADAWVFEAPSDEPIAAPLINPLTGERELSVRQAVLVDRVISDASTVSPDGAELLRWTARVLGLGDYFDPPAPEGTSVPV